MNCEYCNQPVKVNEMCRGCGAKADPPEWTRGYPFEHEGYIVWPLNHCGGYLLQFVIYLGMKQVGMIEKNIREISQMEGYGEGIDIFPDIFDEWISANAQA